MKPSLQRGYNYLYTFWIMFIPLPAESHTFLVSSNLNSKILILIAINTCMLHNRGMGKGGGKVS